MQTTEPQDYTGDAALVDPKDKARLAREMWRANRDLTGVDLADHFEMSAPWGRKQIRAVRAEEESRGTNVTAASRESVTRLRPASPPSRDAVTQRPAPPSRPPAPRHARPSRAMPSAAVRRVTAAAMTLVAVVAAAASYSHMHDLAVEAGEGPMARVLPLSVDGLVVAATMTLLSARRAGRKAGTLPWGALFLGLGASLAANVAAAEPTVVGRLVAAWPPVALALSFELLLRQTRGEGTR